MEFNIVRRIVILAAALPLLAAVQPARSQDTSVTQGWQQSDNKFDISGSFAADHKVCTLQGTTGLSWPDGRQAIVTFWQCYKYLRCIDYFSADMTPTGGRCDIAVGRP